MSDALTILASGVQPNAAHSKVGETFTFPLRTGAIPREQQAKGPAVDCGAYTTLRGVTLTVTDMTAIPAGGMPTPREDEQGRHDSAELFCLLETGPTESGPWTLLHTFEPMKSRGAQRVPHALAPDNYVRASWWYARYRFFHETVRDDVQFTFAISAEALPEAP